MGKLTEAETILTLQAWRLKHNITNVAFTEVIELLARITDRTDGPLSSIYLFEEYFQKLSPTESNQKHYMCSNCFTSYQVCPGLWFL